MEIKSLDLKKQYNSIKEEIDKAIFDCINSSSFILGDGVKNFEKQLGDYISVKFNKVIGCANGSDALLLSLMAIGVGIGDEVITTPFTFFATAGSIARLGAKPVFVDIKEDFNINEDLIENKITSKTKAIISVDLYGLPCNQIKIKEICSKNKIFYISDSAQSIGSFIDNKKIGTIADFTTFSFFPTKNLGCYGDGGCVISLNDAHADKIRKLRVHGASKKYHHEFVGINSRLDALQTGILSVKLKYLDKWIKRKKEIALIYYKGLKNVKLPKSNKGHVYHQYTIISEKRDKLQKFLQEKGVMTTIYYPLPLHLQECFKDLGYKKGDFPISEEFADKVLSLPIHESLTDEEVEYVIKKVNEFE
jgi:dTDP-4-amino-4,6-dideoxygalactose transaminase